MSKILDLFTPDVHASLGSADLVQWWSRVWVAQELVVAKDSIIHRGKKTLPWECCARTIAAVYSYMTHFQDTPEWKEPEAWDRISDCAYWTMAIAGTASSFHFPCERDLLDLLQRFWLSEATDARDKVCALLSLATDNHPDVLVPNYSLSIGQVYGMSVKDVITRSKNLEIFSLCSSTGARRVEGLPTWVPKLEKSGQEIQIGS